MAFDSEPHAPRPSRRRWIETLAGGTTALLAGCGGGGGDGQSTETQTPPDDTDRTFVTTEFNDPKSNNYNPYDSLNYPTHSPAYIFGHLLQATHRKHTKGDWDGAVGWLPELATDFSLDGDTLQLNLSDEYTWHDGDPVVAKDVLTRLRLDKMMDEPNFQRAFVSAEIGDEHTVDIKLQNGGQLHTDVVLDILYTQDIDTKYSEYKRFLPNEDPSFGGDVDNFQKDLLRSKLLNYQNQDPVGWGPWKFVELTDRTVTLERYDDHPYADRINFPRIKFEWYSTNQAKFQNIIAGNFDGVHARATTTVAEQIPDHYRTYKYNARTGMGLAFNYERIKDHRVRRAMAFVLDKQVISKNSGRAWSKPHKWDTSFYHTKKANERYFGSDIFDKLTRYDKNDQRAAKLLRAAGWTKKQGQWHKPGGEKASYTIKIPPTWPDWLNMAEMAANHLSEFGIETNVQVKELIVYYGKTMNQATYDMAGYWSGGARPFPYYSLKFMWFGNETVPESHNHPTKYQVPMPIGNPNGNRQQVDVGNLLGQISHMKAFEKRKQKLRRLVWTYNQMMPVYCLVENHSAYFLDTNKWIGPPTDSKQTFGYWPSLRMMHEGLIKARANPQ